MVSSKVDLSWAAIARLRDLDDLARMLFPGNRNHQRIFLAVLIELKWSDGQFLPVLETVADKHGFSRRSLETVRGKMRRLGIIDHVSRFNKKYGYREGWILSGKFANSLDNLGTAYKNILTRGDGWQREKESILLHLH